MFGVTQMQAEFVFELGAGSIIVATITNVVAMIISHSKTRFLLREYRLHAHVVSAH